jgi:UDP-N-acetylglucosamine--N-acetylmuramyl-(pentapeptide) pyrophosphoryl-undecaprenol N-acetylglucosamine transferase
VRLLICAGGTGGGVYPALVVLQQLEDKLDSVLWVGGSGGMEKDLVERQNIPFIEIPAAGVHGVGLRSLPSNLFKLAQGVFTSLRILKDFQPDGILYTGGYVAAPMALAARKIPSLLYVPDIEPGMALNFLSRFAKIIALTTEASRKYFVNRKAQKTVTGYPIRQDLKHWDKDQAYKIFNLQTNLPVLLVTGGSKGARSINKALISILPQLLSIAQVIHITGKLDWDEVHSFRQNLPVGQLSNYHIYPYLHEEMGAAFTAADLVISRSGASTLGEYPLFGLPAILVPYPYAWRYQKVNAQYLADHHAAILVRDEDLKMELLPVISNLLMQPHQLQTMSNNMRALHQASAAEDIASLVMTLAQTTPQKGERPA